MSLGLDWIRCSGPAMCVPVLREWLSGLFGEPEPAKGLWFYDHAFRWEGSVYLCHSDLGPHDHCTFDIPGDALAQFTADERIGLVRDALMRGFRATRIDVALDLRGDDLSLIRDVTAACNTGELTGTHVVEFIDQHKSMSLTGQTVYLGRRGKDGSGRLVRLYDKGLETATERPGRWLRWESEFAKDCAAQVAERLALSADWPREALSLALGCVDFRLGGPGPRGLRSPWWSDFLGGVEPERVTPRRNQSELATFVLWLRRCAAPTLTAMAQLRGVAESEIWSELVGEVQPLARPHLSPVVREWCRLNGVSLPKGGAA